MNPMQLLTVSKSLMGVKNATGRYRMAEGNLLPKFNPAARTGADDSPVKAERVKLVTKLQMENQATARSKTESKQLSIKQTLYRALGSFFKSGRSVFTTCRKAGSSITGTLKKIKPLTGWKGRLPGTKTEKIKSIKCAVQGELSLDKVKVVRNDLSDTDLEIVPVTKVERSESTGPVTMLVAQGEPSGTSFGRFTMRIFGARQTPN